MLIGYARVSTNEQNLDLQLDAFKVASIAPDNIFTDTISTSKPKEDREGLDKAMSHLRAGDTLVVWRLDRLGRTLRELIDLIEELGKKGVGFKSITENLDTTTPGGMLIFHIFGALAQFERSIIKERTNAGLQAARARGKLGGRRKVITDPKKLNQMFALYDAKTDTVSAIIDTYGISRATFYKYLVNRNKP
jgi:DNA invertase Pin-like site-specific DNA recombinase